MSKVRIRIVLYSDDAGGLDKLATHKEVHAKKGDEVEWRLTNEVGRDIKVSLGDFDPNDYLEFAAGTFPVEIKDTKSEKVTAKVIKNQADDTTVKYHVFVGSDNVDPDIIIDGDGTVHTGSKKKGGKKQAGRKPGVRRPSKKKRRNSR